ncbi:MAG: DUF1641 domain-containing protein [Alphaproteobacteria bacterium]|nr:DUF1641 domain-containing protein [Alphaproteobacteria bacterium]
MSEPTTAELLTQVLERLDRLEKRIDAIQGTTDGLAALGEKVPVFVELAGATASFAQQQAEANGIDPVGTGLQAAEIALVAAKPDSIATVKRLLAKQALLHKTLDAVERLEADGTLDVLIDKGTAVAPTLAKTVGVAETATTALVETQSSGFQPLGLFGQLKAMMDPDVQKAMGFGLAIAKRFGQKL